MPKNNGLQKNTLIALILIAAIMAGGWFINSLINKPQYETKNTQNHQQTVDQNFNNAIAFMQNKQFKQAVHQWHQLLVIKPDMPEAHVNLGFSLYELGKYMTAGEYFQRAMDINPYQVNAYYGLAICYEKSGDIQAAIGAMRSYIHLAKKDAPFARKAKAALWEWESKLDKPAETKDEVLQKIKPRMDADERG